MHNTHKLYIKENRLCKLFNSNSFIDEKSRNIDFLIKNRVPNTPEIFDKIYVNNNICGYEMEYIPIAISFRQAINENIPIGIKIKAIKDVYESMKFI